MLLLDEVVGNGNFERTRIIVFSVIRRTYTV